MNSKPVLTNIIIVKPPYEKTQQELNQWLTECHIQAERNNSSVNRLDGVFNRYMVKATQIAKRSFECADVLDADLWDKKLIYRITPESPQGVDILERNKFFSERASAVMNQFYTKNIKIPQLLIHVTCTGYISPSAAQILVAEKKWQNQTAVTHAYHMGCYAALPAIRMAQGFVKKDIMVDIAHTEMCGLHMNPQGHTPEQIIVQSLFADGHVKYSVVNNDLANRGDLRILAIKEFIIPDTQQDMSWIPGSWGLQMTLSRKVPEKIEQHLKTFITALCQEFDFADILKTAIFAIHPGGPKIIEVVQKTLELHNDQCWHSKKVLFERGNMSSATLPHIWKEITDSNPPSGKKIVSLVFGPGLTVFGSVFEVI